MIIVICPTLNQIAKVLSPGFCQSVISYNYLSDSFAITVQVVTFAVLFTHPEIEYSLYPGVIDEY